MVQDNELDWITRVNSLTIQPLGTRPRSSSNPPKAPNSIASPLRDVPSTVAEEAEVEQHDTISPCAHSIESQNKDVCLINSSTDRPNRPFSGNRNRSTSTSLSRDLDDSDAALLGPRLQKTRSTPNFPSKNGSSSAPATPPISHKKSWFSKLRKGTSTPPQQSPVSSPTESRQVYGGDWSPHYNKDVASQQQQQQQLQQQHELSTPQKDHWYSLRKPSVSNSSSPNRIPNTPINGSSSSLATQTLHVNTAVNDPFPLTSSAGSFGTPCKPTISPENATGSFSSYHSPKSPSLSSNKNSAPFQPTPQASTSFESQDPASATLSAPGIASPRAGGFGDISNTSGVLPTIPTEQRQNSSGLLISTLRKLKSPNPPSLETSSTSSLESTNSSGIHSALSHTSSLSAASSRSVKSTTAPTISQDNLDKELSDIPLTRVAFAVETFDDDPPQQIPSRKPKPGNVNVDEATGQIIRPHHQTMDGAAVSAYSHAATVAKSTAYNSAVIVANSVRADIRRAQRLSSLSKFTGLGGGVDKEREKLRAEASCDEQFAKHAEERGFGAKSIEGTFNKKTGFPSGQPARADNDKGDENSDSESTDDGPKPLSLVDLYTRCCHLREILPIQATLRQLQDMQPPLTVIQLMNPRPTLIEVLAFADFLSVAPISCIILDNVDMTEEMFRHIILSLINANHLYKLSLKNVNLTPTNWKLLCTFLAHNKWITKLDLSLQFPENGKKKIRYRQSEYYGRESLNWDLLTRAIIKRGGIEEVNLNSCYIPHDQFYNFIVRAASISTRRLGVSCSDLQEEDINVIGKWIQDPTSTCQGIDLSGNPNISKLPKFMRQIYTSNGIMYLSLNSCNLDDPVTISSVMTECAPQSFLKFLDISFNPKLFPYISKSFFAVIPHMKELVRLYLDYNDLSSQDIIMLADAIPHCPKLAHISLAGNRDINDAAAEALAVAVKLSSTITLVSVDSGILSANIARRLTHYCIQNMEKYVAFKKPPPEPIDLELPSKDDENYNFEGEDEILDDGKELIKAVNYVVERNNEKAVGDITDVSDSSSQSLSAPGSSGQDEKKDKISHLTADGLAKRAERIREKVQLQIQELTKTYQLRDMPDVIRDKLVRFWYLDKTLEDVIQRYELSNGKIHLTDLNINGGYETRHIVTPNARQHIADAKNNNSDAASTSPNGESPRRNSSSDSDGGSTETDDTSSHDSDATHQPHGQNGPVWYREFAPLNNGSDTSLAKRLPNSNVAVQDFVNDDGKRDEDENSVYSLTRQPSSASLQAKKQDREEGELHKLGLMMRRKVLQRAGFTDQDMEEGELTEGEEDYGHKVYGGIDEEPCLHPINPQVPVESNGSDNNANTKLFKYTVHKSGDELRKILVDHFGNGESFGGEKLEKALEEVRKMPPDDFERYFIGLANSQEKKKYALQLEEELNQQNEVSQA